MATHFQGGGSADGFTGQGTYAWICVVSLLVPALLFGGLHAYQGRQARWAVVVGYATAGLLGSLMTSAVLVNRDLADPPTPGCRCGTSAWPSASRRSRPDRVCWSPGRSPARNAARGRAARERAERLDLAEGETAGWARGAGSPWLGLLGAALTLAACAVAVPAVPVGWAVFGSLLAGGLLVLCFARLQVSVGPRGLTVAPAACPGPGSGCRCTAWTGP
ncbi:hypothetical protein NKH77_42085 [Streptomyces sp. M19]